MSKFTFIRAMSIRKFPPHNLLKMINFHLKILTNNISIKNTILHYPSALFLLGIYDVKQRLLFLILLVIPYYLDKEPTSLNRVGAWRLIGLIFSIDGQNLTEMKL